MSKNYDSDFCGNLPLNFINSIQSYGFLLVLNKALDLIQVSENVLEYFQVPATYFLNRNIKTLIEERDFDKVAERLNATTQEKIPVTFSITIEGKTELYLAIIHVKKEYILLEMERFEQKEAFTFIYHDVKYIMAKLKNALTVSDVATIAASEIKKLSGFDKIMIYQFDKDWNGIVIAEAMESEMESYMGLRFPASDVPRQARELYLSNPYRFIPDRSYTAVKLNPVLNPATFSYTDLTDCNLRAVAPVHLEYLKNMKVESSMSTPIIKDNKLWGLIACHHRKAKLIDYEMRSAFELVSNFISAQISSKESETTLVKSSQLKEVQEGIYKRLVKNNNFIEGLFNGNPSVQDLLEVNGVAILFQDQLRTIGQVPSEKFIRDLAFSLKINNTMQIWTTDTHPLSLDPETKEKGTASGYIAIPIATEKGEFIIGFRGEFLQKVNWSGNPNEAIQFEPDKKNYHPRNSFSIWQETVQLTSLPWKQETIDAAEKLRLSLLEIRVRNNN